MRISLIWAMAANRVIGHKCALPWQLPGDLALFKKNTLGKPVIMGRRTFDTLDKPLSKRTNIVMTRSRIDLHADVQIARDFDQALALAKAAVANSDCDECMVAGGSDIYTLALPKADRLYMTLVHGEPEGDTCFPAFDQANWRTCKEQRHTRDKAHSHDWSEFILERK